MLFIAHSFHRAFIFSSHVKKKEDKVKIKPTCIMKNIKDNY
jgi:hypothetical protein